jgi:hypothetical protein
MLASTHFDITRTEDDDWFDTILDVDTELFVDPFLVFKETAGLWSDSHQALITHFERAFVLVAEGNSVPASVAYRKAEGLLLFKEPRELCLGYTARGTRGAGSGSGFAKLIAAAIADAIARGLENPAHFEELGILRTGIGPDRISDATCTILKPKLIEYTQEIAARHRIPVESHKIYAGSFDAQRQRFRSPTVELPTNPSTGDALLFVPERFLEELPQINAEAWWDYYEASCLREDVNYEIMGSVDKGKIAAAARENPESVREWAQAQEEQPAHPYDLSRDRKGVVQWERAANEFTSENPLAITPPTDEAEFETVIERIIEKFRLFIEQQRGWWLLWDGINEKAELAPQLILYGIARNYCEANNIVVSREVEVGRGPVDFTFSNGYKLRAHLEVKKLNNGKFWNGLDRQLPTYLASDEVEKGWFVAVRYRSGKQWDKRETELPTRVKAAAELHGRDLRSAIVDGRPQASASKL